MGYTQEEIFNFCNDNQEYSKEKIMDLMMKEFNFKRETVQKYYYNWKRAFIKTDDCVPSEGIIIEDDYTFKELDSTIYKGKYGDYLVVGNKVIVGDKTFKSIRDVENYRKSELKKFYKKLGELCQVIERLKGE